MPDPHREAVPTQRSRKTLVVLGLLSLVLIACLLALGTWQVQRLSWKLDLIEKVDARVHAAAVEAPGPSEWGDVTADKDAYRHVRVTGTFLYADETLVYAVTELGAGSWVMTPLRRTDGTLVYVNRGFVPAERRDPASRQAASREGPVTVVGLLRVSEPGGSFLQSNIPLENRWYSRDVAAMAQASDLGEGAPYFIDADATPNPGGLPVGGMTRIVFSNSHLVYAITWYTLALMLAGATVFVGRLEWRRKR